MKSTPCSIERSTRGGLTVWVLKDPATDAVAEIFPERGAIATRLRLGGEELLYLDEATLLDRSKKVRGGIPVLFPIAGKLPDDRFRRQDVDYQLPQHGFARSLPWDLVSADADGSRARLALALSSTHETLESFPFSFRAVLAFVLTGDALRLELTVTNEDRRPLPLHTGFHPYFRVPEAAKARTTVETRATRCFDNRTRKTRDVPSLDFTQEELDLHLLDHGATATTLRRPDAPEVKLSWSPDYETLVLWTLRGKDFVCVEPWTAPAGALASGEGLVHVPTRSTATLWFEIAV